MKAFLPLAVLCLLFGCTAPTGTGVSGSIGGCKGSDCSHGSTGGRGGTSGGFAGSSGTGGTTSSGGDSSGGATSGSTGGTSNAGTTSAGGTSGGNGLCNNVALPDGGGCPSGSFVSDAFDFFTCAPIGGATVQALDDEAVPLPGSVLTATDGTFILCGPASGAFTPMLSAPSYATTYYPELQPDLDSTFASTVMISTNFIAVLGNFGIGTSTGTILVHVGKSTSCPDPSGWSVSLTEADGGAVADGGYTESYLSAAGLPASGLTATTSSGAVFLHGLDTSTASYYGISASKPDAGPCTPLALSAHTTGRIYVQANAISIYPLQVRP